MFTGLKNLAGTSMGLLKLNIYPCQRWCLDALCHSPQLILQNQPHGFPRPPLTHHLIKGALQCQSVTWDRGEAPAGLKKFYYICFEKLFLRPCSNVKRISGTSNTVGHLITYKRSNSAQLNRIFTVFVILVNVLDEAALLIDCLYKNSITTEWSRCHEIIRKWRWGCGISIQIGIQLEWDSDSNGICGPFCRLTTASDRNQQNILPWERFCRCFYDQ